MTYNMEEAVHEALKIPRVYKLTAWDAALQEHRGHPSFRTQTHPYTLEYGFTCQCSGVEHEWRIYIGNLKLMVPAALESVRRIFGFGPKAGDKLRKKQTERACIRARALLHRFLTREQRIELRGTQSFKMRDRAGRTYHVTEGAVYLEHEGTKYSLCVVPIEPGLPAPDIMLARRVMLEADPEAFLRLARVRNTVTGECYESGGFFLGDEPQPVKGFDRTGLVELTPEQIENPQEWVEGRLGVVLPTMETEQTEIVEETVERVETRDV